jgi:hypothetical protein
MLDHDWTCLGDNTFVNSAFSTSGERANVYALNVVMILFSWIPFLNFMQRN